MNTKESIIQESLQLFAQKGYESTSVREIAKAVGVRESALYKHFKNKEDILNQVIEETRHRILEVYKENNIPEIIDKEDIAGGYRRLSTDDLCEIAWNIFEIYTKDPLVANFRRLLTREQYNNPDISNLYNLFFLEGAVEKQALTFASIVTEGMFLQMNPKIIALQFYSPILLLFQLYDCQPEREGEIKNMVYDHIQTFGKLYEKREG